MVTASVTPVRDSVYQVSYTLTVVGAYTLTVELNGKQTAESKTTVVCSVTLADPQNTALQGQATTVATAGILQSFEVILHDSGNNRLVKGGDSLHVTLD